MILQAYKYLITKCDSFYNTLIIKHFHISVGKNIKINGKLHINGQKQRIMIGDSVVLNSDSKSTPLGYQPYISFWCFNEGRISIGDHCGISNATLCSQSEICIEDHVLIGGGVKIFDTDFHSLLYEKRIDLRNDNDRKTAPIIIKKGCFIGAGAIVLKGVTIGEKSIVGAGAVVTKDIPDGEIWAGNPAKFIRRVPE